MLDYNEQNYRGVLCQGQPYLVNISQWCESESSARSGNLAESCTPTLLRHPMVLAPRKQRQI
uniref:Uncharacterized protein n=2 Tax=Physcomitrium patens TaxID=3218 RepID=A0A2K1IG92_PHYPA|nr:hypothetical protein PHYPA_028888 [Physcomitrium patens]